MKNFKLFVVSALIIISMVFAVSCTTTVTVSFDPNGGIPTYYASQSVAVGGLAKDPGTPVRTGYIFLGWFADNSAKAWDFASDKVSANTKLTARWKELEATHTVTVSWEAVEGAKAEDTQVVSLAYAAFGGWIEPPDYWVTIAGDINKYTFTVKDSDWVGKILSASIIYRSADSSNVAIGGPDLEYAVAYTGLENVELPEIELIPANID